MKTTSTLRDWLGAEDYTLSLSAGFFGFFAHAGFLAALEEAHLHPAQLSGASAGALVAGLWASGRNVSALKGRLFALQRTDFWDPAFGAGLLRGERFERLLEELLDARTFEECRAPLHVSTFALAPRKTVVHRQGPLAPAIRASCALPGLFHPIRIGGTAYVDGGVADRSGLHGVPEHARILYHHLPTRSRWRRFVPRYRSVPSRPAMLPVITEGLPRVGPFQLERGPYAFEAAYQTLKAALDRPLPPMERGAYVLKQETQ